jgi:hypothetical protein
MPYPVTHIHEHVTCIHTCIQIYFQIYIQIYACTLSSHTEKCQLSAILYFDLTLFLISNFVLNLIVVVNAPRIEATDSF